jgi:hypothetical protein
VQRNWSLGALRSSRLTGCAQMNWSHGAAIPGAWGGDDWILGAARLALGGGARVVRLGAIAWRLGRLEPGAGREETPAFLERHGRSQGKNRRGVFFCVFAKKKLNGKGCDLKLLLLRGIIRVFRQSEIQFTKEKYQSCCSKSGFCYIFDQV